MTTDELVGALKDISRALTESSIYLELADQNLKDVVGESHERIGELQTTISDLESEVIGLQNLVANLEADLEEEIAAR